MKLPFVFRKTSGFTLIELLIVMAIIAILISIGLASFNRAQQQARDSERKSDLQNVAGALEQFYSDNNKYPAASSGKISVEKGDPSDCGNTGSAISWGTGKFSCGFPETTYLRQLPNDPLSSQPYYYDVCASQQIYTLSANLEIDPSAAISPPTGCNVGGGYDFMVTSQD